MADTSAKQPISDLNSTSSLGMREVDRSGGVPISVTKSHYYLMRGVDADAGTLTYVTWVVNGAPDTTGAQYTGAKAGGSPLGSIVVLTSWLA